MTDTTYVEPHEPYIEAVVRALDAAGITTADWYAGPNTPLDGNIDLASDVTAAVYGDREVSLLWNEERGWRVGWGQPDSQSGLEQVVDLSTGVLPSPAEVVALARSIVAEIPGPDSGSYAWYRDCEDKDDFEERLAAYAKAGAGEGEGR